MVEGSGWTEVDGVRYDWKAWDAIHIPAWSWHRHGNDGDKPGRFMSYSSEPTLWTLGMSLIEDAGGAVAVPAHVDAGAQAPGGLLELHVLLADDALAVVAPLLEKFFPTRFLDVIVRGGGAGLGRHGLYVLLCRTSFHLVARVG
jgi:hypothetical protein